MAWAGAIRDVDDPTDDGHMVLFQFGHPPNDPDSDDRDVSSAHRGFVQFVMCDGAIRAVQKSIDPAAYLAFSTRGERRGCCRAGGKRVNLYGHFTRGHVKV